MTGRTCPPLRVFCFQRLKGKTLQCCLWRGRARATGDGGGSPRGTAAGARESARLARRRPGGAPARALRVRMPARLLSHPHESPRKGRSGAHRELARGRGVEKCRGRGKNANAKQRVPLGASTLLPVRHDSQGDTVSWAQSGAGQRRPRGSGFVLGAPPPLRIVPPEPRHRRVSGASAPQLAACCTRRPWGHTRHRVWRASPLRSALAPGEASHPCALRAGVFHLHVTPLYVATSLQVRGNPRMQ